MEALEDALNGDGGKNVEPALKEGALTRTLQTRGHGVKGPEICRVQPSWSARVSLAVAP